MSIHLGRILILWRLGLLDIDIVGIHSQLIHFQVTCKVTSHSFLVTFSYGFKTIVARRDMWNFFRNYEQGHVELWLVLVDFNLVFKRRKDE